MVFGKLVVFLVGVYAGVYADQHYKMPSVDDPQAIWKQVKEVLDNYKKENPGPSKSD